LLHAGVMNLKRFFTLTVYVQFNAPLVFTSTCSTLINDLKKIPRLLNTHSLVNIVLFSIFASIYFIVKWNKEQTCGFSPCINYSVLQLHKLYKSVE